MRKKFSKPVKFAPPSSYWNLNLNEIFKILFSRKIYWFYHHFTYLKFLISFVYSCTGLYSDKQNLCTALDWNAPFKTPGEFQGGNYFFSIFNFCLTILKNRGYPNFINITKTVLTHSLHPFW